MIGTQLSARVNVAVSSFMSANSGSAPTLCNALQGLQASFNLNSFGLAGPTQPAPQAQFGMMVKLEAVLQQSQPSQQLAAFLGVQGNAQVQQEISQGGGSQDCSDPSDPSCSASGASNGCSDSAAGSCSDGNGSNGSCGDSGSGSGGSSGGSCGGDSGGDSSGSGGDGGSGGGCGGGDGGSGGGSGGGCGGGDGGSGGGGDGGSGGGDGGSGD